MIRILLACALLAACAPNRPVQITLVSCGDTRTQGETEWCAVRAFQAADSVLNEVYPRVVAGVYPVSVRPLQRAQRQWVRMRRAGCALRTAGFEGSMYRTLYAVCMERETRERVVYLRRLLPESRAEKENREGLIEAAQALFTAMQQKDTTALRTLIHPRAQIVAISAEGVSVRTADEWIRALPRNREVLIERMWNPQVQMDRGLATLWAPYDFHLGERFSHCGMDAFQFVWEGGAWRMIAITFTRQTVGCEGAPAAAPSASREDG